MPYDRETSSKIEDLEDQILYLKSADREHWDEREKQSEALDQAESRIKELEEELQEYVDDNDELKRRLADNEKELQECVSAYDELEEKFVTHDAKQVSEAGAGVHGVNRQPGETGTPIVVSLNVGGSLFRVVGRAVRQDPDDCDSEDRSSPPVGRRLHDQGPRESGGDRAEGLGHGACVERGSDRQPPIPRGVAAVCGFGGFTYPAAGVVAGDTGTSEPNESPRRAAEPPDARVGHGSAVQVGGPDGTAHADSVGRKPVCFNQITQEARGLANAFHAVRDNGNVVNRLGDWLSADPPAFYRVLPPLITVDFDGVMVQDKYPGVGKIINKGLRDLLTVLRVWGVHLTANTCRKGPALEAARPVIESWLHLGLLGGLCVNENSPERVEFYGGDCRKISADLYIEDRALGWPHSEVERIVWLLLWCKRNLCWSDRAMGLRFRETPLW